MWSSNAQIEALEGNRGPGLVMPVLLPLLMAAAVAVWGLYGSALDRAVDSFEGTARASLEISAPARGLQ